MFPIQSSVDLYQLFAILQAGGWDAGCLNRGGQFANCSIAQLEAFNEYAASLLADWSANLTEGKASRQGEGAFIESCLEHVAEQNHHMYDGYAIDGVSMQQALGRWWLSDSEPAAQHIYRPCQLSLTPPHQCNPSCSSGVRVVRAETSDGTVPGALDGPERAEELAEAALLISGGKDKEWVQLEGVIPSVASLALLSETGAVAENVARS